MQQQFAEFISVSHSNVKMLGVDAVLWFDESDLSDIMMMLHSNTIFAQQKTYQSQISFFWRTDQLKTSPIAR